MMKTAKSLVLGFLFLFFIGCSGGDQKVDPCEEIEELCPKEGVHRCSSDNKGFQTCQRDVNGCLVWTDTTPCGERKICRSLGTDATCQCNHECTKEGATTCSSDNKHVQLCATHASGCLVLENHTDCSQAGKTCYFSNHEAECVEPCTDQCPGGSSRCSGNLIQLCSRPQRCTEWVNGQDCSLNGKKCVVESGQAVCKEPCSNRCPAVNATRCRENFIQICATATDGCLDWQNATNCSDQGKYCNDSTQPAICADACQHQCQEVELNTRRCQPGGQVIQTCALDQNNCRVWQNGVDCAQQSRVCDDNNGDPICAATCQNQCASENATRCHQNNIQTCRKNPQDGCLYWQTTGSCGGDTPLCDDSQGQALCTCSDTCPAINALQCAGDVLQNCATDGDSDPCLEWKTQQDCASSGQQCNPNLNPPACEAACTPQCNQAGDKRCDITGNLIQICANRDGCLIWTTDTDCSASGKTCSNAGGQPECV